MLGHFLIVAFFEASFYPFDLGFPAESDCLVLLHEKLYSLCTKGVLNMHLFVAKHYDENFVCI